MQTPKMVRGRCKRVLACILVDHLEPGREPSDRSVVGRESVQVVFDGDVADARVQLRRIHIIHALCHRLPMAILGVDVSFGARGTAGSDKRRVHNRQLKVEWKRRLCHTHASRRQQQF